ncbi:MAG: hypothetical protein FI703_01985 [SAR202 cluster bacterium]|nr:hypothetical protein [SAR202 cluster bacterium]
MAKNRFLLEMGMGTDLHGKDNTKAAVRAIREAIWHNSFGAAKHLGKDVDDMFVDVTIGAPDPSSVNGDEVLDALPHGNNNTITIVQGGLEVPNEDGTDSSIIVNAAVVVSFDM